jgi:peptidoglycan/LPS O-acetylase OafA/YrhL
MKAILNSQDTTRTLLGSSQSTTRFPKSNESKNQILVLNGVRAIACSYVLIYHLNEIASETGIWGPTYDIHNVGGTLTFFAQALSNGGFSGVHLFFMLSGFLLFLPYAKSLLFNSPCPSMRRFYLRRIFRIIPGYYVTLFLMALFFHPIFLRARYWSDLWLFLTFRMNFSLAGQLNGVFWTLAIEFQFYFLLPIIAWLFGLVVRRGGIHWRMCKLSFCLLIMMAWGLLTTYWGLYLANTTKLDFLIPHRISLALEPLIYGDKSKYLEVFAIGMLVCMLYTYMQYAPSAQRWSMRMRYLSPLLLTMGLAMIFFVSFWVYYFTDLDVQNFTKYARYVRYTKYHIIFTLLDPHLPTIVAHYLPEWQNFGYAIGYGLCILAVLYGPVWIKRPLESAPLLWVASISFSLYMWHQQLMYLFRDVLLFQIQAQHFGHLVEYVALWCWTLVIALPVSATFYARIEKPGIQLGEWLIRKLGM